MLEGANRRTYRLRTFGAHALAVLFVTSCQTLGSVPATGDGLGLPGAPRPRLEAPVGGGSTSPSVAAPTNRGLWVLRTTLVYPDSVRAMVIRAAEAGFNTLLVQVRGRGDSYFSGGIEPRADALSRRPDFDPLALTLDEAHRRGLEVHAWMNVHLVANASSLPADRDHLVHARPDLLAVPRELAGELYSMSPEDTGYLESLRRPCRPEPNPSRRALFEPVAPGSERADLLGGHGSR